MRLKIELFYKEIEEDMESNPELRLNICNDCSEKQYEPFAQDTGICDVCGIKNEVANPYIYEKITGNNYDIMTDWYGKVPRIYHDDTKTYR